MLDLNRIVENPEELKSMLKSRRLSANEVDWLVRQEELRRKLAGESEEKKALRNQLSKKIGTAKQQGVSDAEIKMITREIRALGPEIAALDVDIAELEDKINVFLLSTPNYPHASVPAGNAEVCSVEVYHWNAPQKITWEPKPYWNIGADLRIFDYDLHAAVSDTQSTVYRGLGAQLERAVVNFLLDTHIRAGYSEVATPYIILNDRDADLQSLLMVDDAAVVARPQPRHFRLAQSSVLHLYRDTDLADDRLPVHHCSFSACFRSAAGNNWLDTCDLIEQHQLNKVELVQLCKPEHSYEELQGMTEQAQKVLQLLNLPYRVILKCAAELDFSAAKTYDLEVWMPSGSRYVPVSSCSNCEDFHARRLNIRYQEKAGGEPRFCHSLNGSGLMIGRTVAAILENHQNEDGSVSVPGELRPYMRTDVIR